MLWEKALQESSTGRVVSWCFCLGWGVFLFRGGGMKNPYKYNTNLLTHGVFHEIFFESPWLSPNFRRFLSSTFFELYPLFYILRVLTEFVLYLKIYFIFLLFSRVSSYSTQGFSLVLFENLSLSVNFRRLSSSSFFELGLFASCFVCVCVCLCVCVLCIYKVLGKHL